MSYRPIKCHTGLLNVIQAYKMSYRPIICHRLCVTNTHCTSYSMSEGLNVYQIIIIIIKENCCL